MKKLFIVVFTVSIIISISTEAFAIVSFARRYNMECSGCHIAGFKLTKTGQDFLRRGHAFSMDTKNDSTLSDHVSLTEKVRVFTQSKVTEETNKADVNSSKSTVEAHNFTIYAGGPLDNGFSYFAEMYFQENSGKTSGDSDFNDFGRSKLAEAYIQWTSKGDDNYTSVRAGQVSPSLIHLHGSGARLAQSRPLPLTSKVGDNPYQARARQYGVTMGHSYQDIFGEIGIVNGTGNTPFNRVDNDVHKDVWATVDYSFGEEGSMLGLYYYDGKYPFTKVAAAEGFDAYDQDDEFFQWGILGNYTIEQGAILWGYLTGKNEYKKTGSSKVSQTSAAYFVEFQAYISDDLLAPFFRYEFSDPDTDRDDNENSNVILGINWKAFQHGRFVLEAKQGVAKKSSTKEEKTQNLLLEMQWMF